MSQFTHSTMHACMKTSVLFMRPHALCKVYLVLNMSLVAAASW